MKKLLLALLILSAGAISFATLHRIAEQVQAARAPREDEWSTVTKRLTELNEAVTVLRDEVGDKKSRLKQMRPGEGINYKLLSRLESKKLNSDEWAELRRELGIGWESSDDYVLVSKRVLKQLQFDRLSALEASDTVCSVLAISTDEQSGIKTALGQARESVLARVQRTEPVGDIVAQYTMRPDLVLEQSISNKFAASISTVLGDQRADVFLDQGWRELRFELALTEKEPVTMTIRRSMIDGEPKLTYECRQGDSVSSEDVRYAHYPSCFSLGLFPGGWGEIARREGFELPKSFGK